MTIVINFARFNVNDLSVSTCLKIQLNSFLLVLTKRIIFLRKQVLITRTLHFLQRLCPTIGLAIHGAKSEDFCIVKHVYVYSNIVLFLHYINIFLTRISKFVWAFFFKWPANVCREKDEQIISYVDNSKTI